MASTVAVSTGRRADLAWPSQHLPVDAIGILPASLGLTDSEVSGQLDVRVAGAAGCRQVLPVDSGRWVARTPNVMAAVTILAQGRLPVAATACRGMDALAVGLGRLLVAVLALNRGDDGTWSVACSGEWHFGQSIGAWTEVRSASATTAGSVGVGLVGWTTTGAFALTSGPSSG